MFFVSVTVIGCGVGQFITLLSGALSIHCGLPTYGISAFAVGVRVCVWGRAAVVVARGDRWCLRIVAEGAGGGFVVVVTGVGRDVKQLEGRDGGIYEVVEG